MCARLRADCQAAANTVQDADLPATMPAVETPVIDELATLQQQLAPHLVADYTTCMATEAGVQVQEGTIADAYTAAQQKFPPTNSAKPFNPDLLTGWDTAVAD